MRFAIVLVCATFSFKAASGERLSLVKRQAGDRKIGVLCPGTNAYAVSCARCDGTWPSQDLTCENQKTFPYSTIRTIEDGITDQTSSARVPCTPPQHIVAKCGKDDVYSVSRQHDSVDWTLYYKLETQCGCKEGKVPRCHGATQLTDDACNFTTVAFCGASAGGESCTA